MKKVLILEDEPLIVKLLEKMIRNIDVKIKVYSFDNLQEAYQCVLEKDIDCFLVDIILDKDTPGDTSGLRFIDSLRKIHKYALAPVIVLTSLEDAKLYTYDKLHCYSFVEKPFDPEKVEKLIKNCLSNIVDEEEERTLFLRKDGIILALEVNDVIYIEVVNRNVHIHTRQKDDLKLPYRTIKAFMDEYDLDSFLQVSRSCIVNKKYIDTIDITNQMIHLKEEYGIVEIGKTFKKILKEDLR